MDPIDPWGILGLHPGSSLADARAARRRLAKRLHPDVHAGGPAGEQAERAARMALVNRALAEVEREAVGRAEAAPSAPPPAPSRSAPPAQACGDTDPDSFSVECLPVDAFEALFLAGYGLGEILETEEPYLIELYLTEPPCFCRLTLVPEAGGSLVTVDVTPAGESGAVPESRTIIELLVSELNSLVAG